MGICIRKNYIYYFNFKTYLKTMNIYIGNLSYDVSSEQLKEVFEAYGTVSSAKVITDRNSGRSKGFGFVEMDNKAEAEAAIEQLDGAEIDGRPVKVNEAKPRN